MHIFFYNPTFLLALLPLVSSTLSSTLTQIPSFGPNPRNVSMYIYVPNPLPPNAPILVAPHWCHGTAQNVFDYRPWASLGDTHGFISIYPNTSNADQCWDVSSAASLSHDGGGDALGIVSMVRWAIGKYGADRDRVFVTGTSSGAMMTNVLLGAYPDVFAAGSAWAGVPFGCFAGDGYGVWNEDCAKGRVVRNGTDWANLVRAAYPGYKGRRPKVQVLHGTKDDVLDPVNLREEIKQWTSVLGVSGSPTNVTRDVPVQGWTRFRYGTRVEAFEAEGVDHNIPTDERTVGVTVDFFDLKCRGKKCFSRKSR